MKIFILAITSNINGILSIYPGATVADSKNEALSNGYLMASERYPGGLYNVVCDDATEFIDLHHINGEVKK